MQTQDSLLVARDKFIEGASSLADWGNRDYLTPTPWSDFGLRFPSDAHFVPYSVLFDYKDEHKELRKQIAGFPSDESEGCPRLRKDSLGALEQAGITVVCTLMAFDWDLPGHSPWEDQEHVGETIGRFLEELEDWSVTSGNWSVFYTTKNGFRVVFKLCYPLAPEDYEEHYRWVVQQWALRGWEFDTKVWGWYRVNRMPNVMRDGSLTSEQDYYLFLTKDGKGLDPEKLGRVIRGSRLAAVAGKQVRATVRRLAEGSPECPSATRCLAEIGEGGRTKPVWYSESRRVLRGRECYGALFSGEPITKIGGRHRALMRFIGQVCKHAVWLNTDLPPDQQVTAERAYALFYPSVSLLTGAEDRESWLDCCWRYVVSIWPREEGARLTFLAEQEESHKTREEQLLAIGRKMTAWDKSPELRSGTPEDVISYVETRLLIVSGRSLFLLKRDGYYSGAPVTRENIVPLAKKLGTQDLFPLAWATKTGERYRSPVDLINYHATSVADVSGRPQIGGSALVEGDCVVKEIYKRADLPAIYSEKVDGWLRAMFGANYLRAEQWIAWALYFEGGPICALSIKGDPGIGKGLFVQGMTEATTSKGIATDSDLFEKHAEALARCAILSVDENWSVPRTQIPAVADKFRQIIGGAPIRVNPKYLSAEVIYNPIRVIMTANNHGVVKGLAGGRNLTKQDREALAVRVMHFDLDDSGRKFLMKEGNAADFTRGWISSGSSETNRKTLASHLLWLFHNRRDSEARGKRFLIDGTGSSELNKHMRVGSGASPLVVETLLDMGRKSSGLLSGEEGHLLSVEAVPRGSFAEPIFWVTAGSVLGHYRLHLSREVGSSGRVTSEQVHAVLESLSAMPPVTTSVRGFPGRAKWYRLSAEDLMSVARTDGWDHAKLLDLIDRAKEETRENSAGGSCLLNPRTGRWER